METLGFCILAGILLIYPFALLVIGITLLVRKVRARKGQKANDSW